VSRKPKISAYYDDIVSVFTHNARVDHKISLFLTDHDLLNCVRLINVDGGQPYQTCRRQ